MEPNRQTEAEDEVAELPEALGTAARRVHPLKAWRMTQRVAEGRSGTRTMKRSDACRAFGVPFNTWDGWERYEDEGGHRKPDPANMRRLFLFTRGAIRPDHFYSVDEWRRALAAQGEEQEIGPGTAGRDGAAAQAANAGRGAPLRGGRPSPSLEAQAAGG